MRNDYKMQSKQHGNSEGSGAEPPRNFWSFWYRFSWKNEHKMQPKQHGRFSWKMSIKCSRSSMEILGVQGRSPREKISIFSLQNWKFINSGLWFWKFIFLHLQAENETAKSIMGLHNSENGKWASGGGDTFDCTWVNVDYKWFMSTFRIVSLSYDLLVILFK